MQQFCFSSQDWQRGCVLEFSIGFAGDDKGRGKHCVFFMAVKDVRNGYSTLIHFNIVRCVIVVVQICLPTTMFLNIKMHSIMSYEGFKV